MLVIGGEIDREVITQHSHVANAMLKICRQLETAKKRIRTAPPSLTYLRKR